MSPTSASEPTGETEKTVAFLGPLASYSHQATRLAFPGEEWKLMPTSTIRDVFSTVQSSAAAYGVVPFENSTHGTVTFTLDGLADRTSCFADVVVTDEVYLDVHHFLLGHGSGQATTEGATESEEKGVPLTDLGRIKRVYSHPQAFGQTAAWRAKYLPGVEAIDVSSTSRAAELAAADENGESAAVAGMMAGRVMGLDVLARWIEDRADNVTRFFVIQKKGVEEEGEAGEGAGEEGAAGDGEGDGNPYDGRYKSLASFTVPHRTPGALADVLECFRRGGINLTSINSLPSLVEPFRYLFFVEFEGSRWDDPEKRVEGVFTEVERVAETWRWLGSWVNKRR